jgi:hypothetical protein
MHVFSSNLIYQCRDSVMQLHAYDELGPLCNCIAGTRSHT